MIHALIGSCRSIEGNTISRTFANTLSSDQHATPTKCSNDWCCAAVRAGAVLDALGSTVLGSHGVCLRPDKHARRPSHIRCRSLFSCSFILLIHVSTSAPNLNLLK